MQNMQLIDSNRYGSRTILFVVSSVLGASSKIHYQKGLFKIIVTYIVLRNAFKLHFLKIMKYRKKIIKNEMHK